MGRVRTACPGRALSAARSIWSSTCSEPSFKSPPFASRPSLSSRSRSDAGTPGSRLTSRRSASPSRRVADSAAFAEESASSGRSGRSGRSRPVILVMMMSRRRPLPAWRENSTPRPTARRFGARSRRWPLRARGLLGQPSWRVTASSTLSASAASSSRPPTRAAPALARRQRVDGSDLQDFRDAEPYRGQAHSQQPATRHGAILATRSDR